MLPACTFNASPSSPYRSSRTPPSFSSSRAQFPGVGDVLDAGAEAVDATTRRAKPGPGAHASTHVRDGTAAGGQAAVFSAALTVAMSLAKSESARRAVMTKVREVLPGGSGFVLPSLGGGPTPYYIGLPAYTAAGAGGGAVDGAVVGGAMEDNDDGGISSTAAAAIGPPHRTVLPHAQHAGAGAALAAVGAEPAAADPATAVTVAATHTLLALHESGAHALERVETSPPATAGAGAGAVQATPLAMRLPPLLLETNAQAGFIKGVAADSAVAAAVSTDDAVVAGVKRKRVARASPLLGADVLPPQVAAYLAAFAEQVVTNATRGEALMSALVLQREKPGSMGLAPSEAAAASQVLVRALAADAVPYHASSGMRRLLAAPVASGRPDPAAVAVNARVAAAASAVDVAARLAAAAVTPMGVPSTTGGVPPTVVHDDDDAAAADVDALVATTLTRLERIRSVAMRSRARGSAASLWDGPLAIERRLSDATLAAICSDSAAGTQLLVRIATAAVALQAAVGRVQAVADLVLLDAATVPSGGAVAVLAGYPAVVADAMDVLRKPLAASCAWLEGDGNLERWAAPLLAAVADGLTSFMPLPHEPDGNASVASLLPHVEKQHFNACWMHAFHALLGVPIGGPNAAGLYHLLGHVVCAGDDRLTWRLASRFAKWEGIINAWHSHNPLYYGLFDTQLANVSLLLNPPAASSAAPTSLLSASYLGYVRLDRSGSSTGAVSSVGGGRGGGSAAAVVAAGAPGGSPFARLLHTVAAELHAAHAPLPQYKAGSKLGAGTMTVDSVRAAIKQLIIFHGHRSGGAGVGHFVTVQLAPASAAVPAAAAVGSSRRWLLTDSAASPRVVVLRERDFPAEHRIFTASQRGVLVYALPVAPTARAGARSALWSSIQAVLTRVGLRSLGPATIPAEVAAKAGGVAPGAAPGPAALG